MATAPAKRKAPTTDGLRALIAWVGAGPEREKQLVVRTKIPQSSVNAYLQRVARCPSERAELLCAATDGGVPFVKDEWKTAKERDALKRLASPRSAA